MYKHKNEELNKKNGIKKLSENPLIALRQIRDKAHEIMEEIRKKD